MFATVLKVLKNEDGATAIEYGLIAALIAVAAVSIMGTVGTNLTNTFKQELNKLGGQTVHGDNVILTLRPAVQKLALQELAGRCGAEGPAYFCGR